jgi:hypothetical protein
VIYFAGYKQLATATGRRHRGVLRRGHLVLRRSAGFQPRRPQDRAFVGNIVQAMQPTLRRARRSDHPFPDADRIIAIGSDRMMAAVAQARTAFSRNSSRSDTSPSARSTARCSA